MAIKNHTRVNNNHTTPKLQGYRTSILTSSIFILSTSKIILPALTLLLPSFLITALANPTSALTYQDNVELQFTWNPTIRISLSSADLIINDLTPGTSADSNIITINVGTNNAYGYTLSATAGSTTNASTNLVNTVDNAKLFTSLATDASLANLTTDNTWGYSFSTDTGTSWSNYSGLPLYTAPAGAELINNDGSGSTPVQFKIAAKASTIQASGAYTNTINFTAVANPEPTPQPITCDAGKICYSENALDSEGTMAEQEATSNTETTLMASNYSRSGYGFAGWSPTMDGSGKIYGPNETITTGDLSSTGMPLYAIWVRSAGSMQDSSKVSTVCNSLTAAPIDGTANLSSVSALTDQRDNNTYAIAKLSDGKCWMIENLRLEAEDTRTPEKQALAQGYGTSATYGNFSGLADAESTNFTNTNPPIANSLYSTNGSTTNTIKSGNGSFYYARMPRYNHENTNSRASNPTANTVAMYSYGNYYTWAAAMASVKEYTSATSTDDEGKTSETANTSLCPTGWRLPYGRSSGNGAVVGGFYNLDYKINNDTNVTDSTASLKIRSFPNNFLYSGSFYTSSANYRGSYGYYWSSTASGSSSSYSLRLGSSLVYPGTYGNSKYNGYSIRCMVSAGTELSP